MPHHGKSRGLARLSAAIALGAALMTLSSGREASASYIQIVPSSATLLPGQSETVSINFKSTEPQSFNVAYSSFVFAYDTTRFTVTNLAEGAFFAIFNYVFLPSNPASGEAGASVGQSSTAAFIGSGITVALATFTLTALADAPSGGALGDLNLQSSFGDGNPTGMYTPSGQITLTPPPTNGYDATLDGTVTVAAVPEPSSLALIGLGIGLAGLIAARQKEGRAGRQGALHDLAGADGRGPAQGAGMTGLADSNRRPV